MNIRTFAIFLITIALAGLAIGYGLHSSGIWMSGASKQFYADEEATDAELRRRYVGRDMPTQHQMTRLEIADARAVRMERGFNLMLIAGGVGLLGVGLLASARQTTEPPKGATP